ncbi:MAG: putative acetyltransferase [Gemmatimonadetes bacterium]|nr:putative acetyltransferase [Gemmatimonadota bacterium]
MHLAPLRLDHRAPLHSLLEATNAFSAEEINVALELFDDVFDTAEVTLRRPERSKGPAFAVVADYEFIGAFDENDELLGYACFGPTPSTSGTWDLYWLAVHPSAQGKGAGRALVRQAEKELEARGARLLVVETSSRQEYAHTREFYARGGYVEEARVRDFYAPSDDRVILTTRLTARERGVATR